MMLVKEGHPQVTKSPTHFSERPFTGATASPNSCHINRKTIMSLTQLVTTSLLLLLSYGLKISNRGHRNFRNLPQKTRIGIGLGFLAWGTIGLYVSDSAEKKLGFEPKEEDKKALEAAVPKITFVEKGER